MQSHFKGSKMNIFEVIGANKKLNEPHVSSVLAWLLDPRQTHGCDTIFLRRFLQLLDSDKSVFSNFLGVDGQMVTKGQQRNRRVDVFLEYPVSTNDGRQRYIDIVIFLSDESNNHVIAIENKIISSSAQNDQLIEQVEGLNLDKDLASAKKSYIYLTPKITDSTRSSFDRLKEIDSLEYKKHIEWSNESENSIKEIFVSCLEDEAKGLMNPMAYETRFILKSFVQFISNNFTLPSLEKSKGGKYADGIIKGLDDIYYFIKKHQGAIFIGFEGGPKALEVAELSKLINRRYKYNESLSGKSVQKNNWIEGNEFIDIVSSKEWQLPDVE